MKFVDLFAGIGGFRTGLEMAGHECVGFVEWDEFARKSYEAIHDTEGEWTARDITEVNEQDVPDHDVLTAGFPCQSFSVAGSRRGFEDTRGTLFFDVARIAKEKQPKIIMLENVKGLLSHDKGKTLDIIAKTLCDIGYSIDFEIVNSKFFGVPQNRERIFIFAYRDDTMEQEPWVITDKGVKGKAKHRISAIEGIKTFNFDWPKNDEVTKRLRDILEVEVDEKFYLSEDKTSALVAKLSNEPQKTEQMILDVSQYRKGEGEVREYSEIAPTLAARDYKEPRLVGVGHHPYSKQKEFNGYHDEPAPCLLATDYKAPKTIMTAEPQMIGHVELNGHDLLKRVYSTEGVSPTLTSMGGGNTEPKIAINIVGQSGSGQKASIYDTDGLMSCLTATDYKQPKQIVEPKIEVVGSLQPEGTTRIGTRDQVWAEWGIAGTLNASDYKQPRPIVQEVRPVLTPDRINKSQNGRVIKENDEEAYTLTAQDVHGVMLSENSSAIKKKLLKLEGLPIREATKQGFALAEEGDAVNFQFPDSQTRRGRVGKQIAQTIEASGINQGVVEEVHSCSTRTRAYKGTPETLEIRKDAVSNSITSVAKDSYVLKTPKYRIRKLTPKECWRLQAYTDEQFQKAVDAGISNSQLYKQAGNSVTVNVIFELAKRL